MVLSAFVADPGAGPSSAPDQGWPVHSNLGDMGDLSNQSPNRGENPAACATASRPASARPGSARPGSARPAAVRAAAARAASASTAERPATTPATIRQSSNDEVGHDILKSQRAILEKLDLLVSAQQGLLATQQQLLVTQQQLVPLKAHKYGVHFDDKSS
ncbi:uncharacterized protein LOC120837857 [Ixodes scapularis]|uniref:uncharacterized protein LOC120837857 n=1 Tax=Ixodes scapularis TaxID=6945 RepID=UPI001AD70488|nr:uncharacterized protein LOC120837857 [Ixodes scapularis]